jgi:Protein of unknown function (DUF3300)
MTKKRNRLELLSKIARSFLVVLCSALLAPGDAILAAQSQPQAGQTGQPAAKIPAEQLDSLVAPIALYPDPMLAQVLAASTYPLELVQLQQWLQKNQGLKDKALVDAVEKQPWDPSVQAMAALPDVVKRLTDDIQWTAELGNAFLAQQSDVMDAVQRMRHKAQGTGNLKSTEQQKVETKVVESKQVIVIEQANPQVVYVPSYNPMVVYGPPLYPYPPIYYPPAGYYAAGMAISFGVGIAMGAAWGGGWGWNAGWGGNNNITVNRNNSFNRNTNINGGNRINGGHRFNGGNRASQLPAGGGGIGNNWQHNPQHRGGTPYGDRGTAQRFGGTSRGDSIGNRQANARQNQAFAGNRAQSGALGGGLGNRASSGGAGNSGARGSFGGGGDRIGNQRVSPNTGGSRGGGFGGGSSGSGARASQQRGSSSMGSRGGGGGRSRGGGRRR